MMSPAVGDLLGTGRDQVFVPGYDCLEANGGSNSVFAYGIHPDGEDHPGGPFMDGWPVRMNAAGGCYSQSIDFVQGGANSPSIADFDDSGQLQVAITPVSGVPVDPEPGRFDLPGPVELLPGHKLRCAPAVLPDRSGTCRGYRPGSDRRSRRRRKAELHAADGRRHQPPGRAGD